MKKILLGIFVVIFFTEMATAEECTDPKWKELFSTEECVALQRIREAHQLTRQMIEKSEAIRQEINRQMKEQLENSKSQLPKR